MGSSGSVAGNDRTGPAGQAQPLKQPFHSRQSSIYVSQARSSREDTRQPSPRSVTPTLRMPINSALTPSPRVRTLERRTALRLRSEGRKGCQRRDRDPCQFHACMKLLTALERPTEFCPEKLRNNCRRGSSRLARVPSIRTFSMFTSKRPPAAAKRLNSFHTRWTAVLSRC